MAHWIATPTRELEALNVPGATLRGWTFRASAQKSQALRVLFFNGNAMDIDGAQAVYHGLAVRGADVTVFDYRGYGFSSGKASVMDFRRDAVLLYDKIAASGPVVVYGFSMGTAMAAFVASQRKVAGLILAGTIASAGEEFPVFARAEGFSPSKIAKMIPAPEAVTAFDEVGLIAQSSAPLLMLHGEADQLVPIQQGREVFASSKSLQKQFISLPDMGHNETVQASIALSAFRIFLMSISRK